MKKTIATLMLSGTFYFVNAQATRADQPTGTANNPSTYEKKNGEITEVDKGTTGQHGPHKHKAEGENKEHHHGKGAGHKKEETTTTGTVQATEPKQ